MNNIHLIGLNATARFPYLFVPPYFRTDSTLYRALDNLEQLTQTPRAMNLSAVLAAASASLQGLFDIENPLTNKSGPISLNIITIASSGERKSTLETKVTKGLKKFMFDDTERLKRARIKHEFLIDEYKQEEKNLRKEAKIASDEGRDYAIEKLTHHLMSEPQQPKPRLMRFEDTTAQSLQYEIQGIGANALLSSSEGAKVLNSLLMRNTSFLNDLWSGESTRVSRKSSDDIIIEDARLTVSIMTQESTVERFITSSKDNIRDNGFFARFLIAFPQSNCGNRQSYGIDASTEAIDKFNERVYQLLQLLSAESDKHERKIVKFSYECKTTLIDISNDIETSMRQGGRFELAKDHASKLVENISRVAAILHCFETYNEECTISEIPTATLLDAINIVAYYSSEFMRLFCAPPKIVTDAEMLMNWFAQKANSGIRYIKCNHILQYGPGCVRKSKALKAALDYLQSDSRFAVIRIGKTKVIDLYPTYPQDFYKQQIDLTMTVLTPLSLFN